MFVNPARMFEVYRCTRTPPPPLRVRSASAGRGRFTILNSKIIDFLFEISEALRNAAQKRQNRF